MEQEGPRSTQPTQPQSGVPSEGQWQPHLPACSPPGLHLVSQPPSAPSPLQALTFVQEGPPSHLHTGRLSWFVEKSKSQGWGEVLASVS